jgi:SAM-dependent methyltransferase
MDLRELPPLPTRRHPWEIARARFFRGLLERHGVLADQRAVLDVGAGDGYVARQLLPRLAVGSRVVCFDEHYTDHHLSELSVRSPAIITTRVRPTDTFDLVLLLDVLEHVADDVGFLTDLVAHNLAPDGVVLLSVPAWPILFTMHDVALHHYRRYTPSQLLRVVECSRLHVVASGGLFHSLLLPRTAKKLGEVLQRVSYPAPGAFVDAGTTTQAGRWTAGNAVTRFVMAGLAIDNGCSLIAAHFGIGLPGMSTWVLARKP